MAVHPSVSSCLFLVLINSSVFMLEFYRRSIKFEKPEDLVAWSDHEHDVSKDGDDVVEDASAGVPCKLLSCDDEKASGDSRCVDFDELKYPHVDWPLSVLWSLIMRTRLCR
jgi:hypothetical protein